MQNALPKCTVDPIYDLYYLLKVYMEKLKQIVQVRVTFMGDWKTYDFGEFQQYFRVVPKDQDKK